MKTVFYLLLMFAVGITQTRADNTHSVASEAVELSGTVTDQDGKGIGGARVCLSSRADVYEALTDGLGHYAIHLGAGDGYAVHVSADGYADYFSNDYVAEVWDRDKTPATRDFTLYNAVEYKSGRRATIILPVAPDPTAGSYYRLSRIEREEETIVVFEREYTPKANVPYVIFPARDFFLYPAGYDLTQDAGSLVLPFADGIAPSGTKTNFPDAVLYGSYKNSPIYTKGALYDCEYPVCLDETADCGYPANAKMKESLQIGAFHAWLVLYSWKMHNFGDHSFVFIDEPNAIQAVKAEKTSAESMYDLQGRRVSRDAHSRGVYVKNGKKIIDN